MEGIKGISSKMGNKWLVLLAVAINGIMVILDMSIVNIAFPRLTRVFEIEPSVVLWITVAYSLVTAGLMPIFGRIGDIFGRKRVFILGYILFTIGLTLCSFSQSILQLILFRVVQAVGGAMAMALGMAIVTAVFPDEERGKALGIMSALFFVGPLIGPVLGGFLLDNFDWRSIFYLRVPIGIIGIIMAWVFLREQRVPNISSKLDLLGAGTLFGSLSCLILFFNLGGRSGFASPPVLLLAAGTVILLALFVVQVRRTEHPVVDLNLFKNRIFTGSNIALGIQSLALSANLLLMPFYLIDGIGYSTLESGLLLAIPPIIMAVIAPLSGWLSDKVGSRLFCTAGMILTCLSLFLFSRLGAEASIADIILSLVIFGMGAGLFMSPNANLIMGAAPKDRLGTASALMNTMRTIGMSCGMAIAGAIFASRQAFYAAQLAHDNLAPTVLEQLSLIGGYQDTQLIAAIICGIGIFATLVRAKKPPSQ
jgi:EmrB/QacA subfamily drug resistance transporter